MLTSIIAATSTRLAVAAAVAITALSVGGSVSSSSHQHLVTADGTSSSAPVSANGGNKGVFGWD